MTAIPSNYGHGGVALQKGHGEPALADVLRGLADDANGAPSILTGLTVAANVVTLAVKGRVLSVQATTGGTTGIFSQLLTGVLATTQYSVAYDSDGYATITFAAADSVTECAVEVSPASYTSS